MTDVPERLSMNDLEAESGTMLPNKEVMSLLDLNLDVDLALDLAAPIDLAVAANAQIAAPIEAAVSANVLSAGSYPSATTDQGVMLTQNLAGSAIANAPQDASIDQTNDVVDGGTTATDAPAAAAHAVAPATAASLAAPSDGTALPVDA